MGHFEPVEPVDTDPRITVCELYFLLYRCCDQGFPVGDCLRTTVNYLVVQTEKNIELTIAEHNFTPVEITSNPNFWQNLFILNGSVKLEFSKLKKNGH